MDIGQSLSQNYPKNADFSLAYQGILLRCGYTQRASEENDRLAALARVEGLAGFSPIEYERSLELGKIRIMVAKRNIEGLRQTSLEDLELRPYLDFAMGNVLDLNHQYDESQEFYNLVIQSPDTPESLRLSANMRLHHPYKETIGKKSGQTLFIQDCVQ